MANSRPQPGCLQPVILPVFCPRDKNETAGLRWRCPTFCSKLLREDARRDSVARWPRLTTNLESTGLASRQTHVTWPPRLCGTNDRRAAGGLCSRVCEPFCIAGTFWRGSIPRRRCGRRRWCRSRACRRWPWHRLRECWCPARRDRRTCPLQRCR